MKEGHIIATKISKYPDWPQVTKVLSANRNTCLVKWFIEEEDGHFVTWMRENGTEVTERIKRKDILFTIDLKDGYLSKNDRVKINSFK